MKARGRTRHDVERIPYVGPSIARDLVDLGCPTVQSLVGRDPERMFERLCEMRGESIDRCVLYVFRSAVYWAGAENPDPEMAKWWRWKDGASPPAGRAGAR